MKNTKWVFDWEFKRYKWIHIPTDTFIVSINKGKEKYELPTNWFGRTKNLKPFSKKSLPKAKAACEKWLKNFIKSISE